MRDFNAGYREGYGQGYQAGEANALRETGMPPPEELTLIGRVGKQYQYKDKLGRIYYVLRESEADNA